MEFELNYGSCSKCNGIENCNKYCVLHAGKALVDFLTRVDVIETKIGDFASREKGGKQDLIVSGHQIWDLTSPSWILTDINTALDAAPKFTGVYDKNPVQIINNYCSKMGMSKQEATEIVTKLQMLNKNRLLVLPFKPHTSCNVSMGDNEKEKKREGEIKYIKWVTDKNTYKLQCKIGFKVNSAIGESTVTHDIKDYMHKFTLSAMDIHAKGDKYDDRLLQITNYGMFKPILIREGNAALAIDGTYLYSMASGDTRIIGYWDEFDNLVTTTNNKSNMMRKINDNLTYIKNHKKYIAPYLMYEANEILM